MALLLSEAVARFLARYDNPLSARSYRQTLDDLLTVVGQKTPLHTITREDIDRWDHALAARNLADATLMSHRRKAKAFFAWCVERRYFDEHIASHLRVRQHRITMASKAIPSDVLLAMMSAVQIKRERAVAVRDYAILALMVTFGARRGDVAKLSLRRVNLRESWLVFRVKGNHEVRLPLPPQTSDALAAWLEIRMQLVPEKAHNYVFTTVRADEVNRHRPLNVESISTMIERLSAEVGGKPYGPHSIRHWFGQHQADQRVPPTVLSSIMGHSDVTITLEHYYNQDFERVRRVLTETELAQRLRPDLHDSGNGPKIIKLDFSA